MCFASWKLRLEAAATGRPEWRQWIATKRREIAAVMRECLRRLPPSCQWSFDVVSVYYDRLPAGRPQIELFRSSSLTA